MTFNDLLAICTKCKRGMHCWDCATNHDYLKDHPHSGMEKLTSGREEVK